MALYKSKLDNLSPTELRLKNIVETILFGKYGYYGVRIYRKIKAKELIEQNKKQVKTENFAKRESYKGFNKHLAINFLSSATLATKVA